jgi:CheY-like chemotaxis protein
MAVLLCTGIEKGLLTTRKLMLENAGHTVILAMSEPAIIEACQRHTFDVAVVGQEENPAKKRRVLTLIRRYCPSTKILEVYRTEVGRTLRDADGWLALPKHEVNELIERVAVLLKRNTTPICGA